jgi:hypothetical protein
VLTGLRSVHQPDANGAQVQDLGQQNGNSFRWTVPFPGGELFVHHLLTLTDNFFSMLCSKGTTLGLLIKDNQGNIGQTAAFPVGSGMYSLYACPVGGSRP